MVHPSASHSPTRMQRYDPLDSLMAAISDYFQSCESFPAKLASQGTIAYFGITIYSSTYDDASL